MEITAESVIEAYKKTGFTPARGAYLNPEKNACCAMTAYLIADHPELEEQVRHIVAERAPGSIFVRINVIEPHLPDFQVHAFEAGFDVNEAGYLLKKELYQKEPEEFPRYGFPEFDLGYEVGQKVFEWWEKENQ
jgi:hypothetical protein